MLGFCTLLILTNENDPFSDAFSSLYSLISAPLQHGFSQETDAVVADRHITVGGSGASGGPAPVVICNASENGPPCKEVYIIHY